MSYITKENKNYINDTEMCYEIILSKGKGYITKELERMIILLCNRIITKMNYYDPMDREDCLQQSILSTLENVLKFHEDKYRLCIPYCTELAKRGLAKGFNIINEIDASSRKIEKVRNLNYIQKMEINDFYQVIYNRKEIYNYEKTI